MPKKTHRPIVSRLTVARLYNLGNYEHVRYEVTVDLPAGARAAETLADMVATLARLKPIKKPYRYDYAKDTLNKHPSQLNEQQKAELEELAETVKTYQGQVALQMAALAHLDDLGGTSRRKDAKLDWEDAPW